MLDFLVLFLSLYFPFLSRFLFNMMELYNSNQEFMIRTGPNGSFVGSWAYGVGLGVYGVGFGV